LDGDFSVSPYNMCREYFKEKTAESPSVNDSIYPRKYTFKKREMKFISLSARPFSIVGTNDLTLIAKRERKKRSMIPPNFVDKKGKK
jgi:hypothetical protein